MKTSKIHCCDHWLFLITQQILFLAIKGAWMLVKRCLHLAICLNWGILVIALNNKNPIAKFEINRSRTSYDFRSDKVGVVEDLFVGTHKCDFPHVTMQVNQKTNESAYCVFLFIGPVGFST